MNSPWKKKYEGTIGGRPVEVESHDDGGHRVRTTQGEDSDGEVSGDVGSITVIPPSEKGRVIEIDGDTASEIRDQLVEEGFSDAEAEQIVGHIDA